MIYRYCYEFFACLSNLHVLKSAQDTIGTTETCKKLLGAGFDSLSKRTIAPFRNTTLADQLGGSRSTMSTPDSMDSYSFVAMVPGSVLLPGTMGMTVVEFLESMAGSGQAKYPLRRLLQTMIFSVMSCLVLSRYFTFDQLYYMTLLHTLAPPCYILMYIFFSCSIGAGKSLISSAIRKAEKVVNWAILGSSMLPPLSQDISPGVMLFSGALLGISVSLSDLIAGLQIKATRKTEQGISLTREN